jgi:hypothetical protein
MSVPKQSPGPEESSKPGKAALGGLALGIGSACRSEQVGCKLVCLSQYEVAYEFGQVRPIV